MDPGRVLEQIDVRRVPALLLLLGAGLFLATLLVRPEPQGSPLRPASQRERRRSFALRGMWLLTLAGLCSGLAGGLLQHVAGARVPVQLLHAVFRVCWLPAYLLRELQLVLAGPGVAAFVAQLLGLLGLLLIPVWWFLALFAASRWLYRRQSP